MIFRRFPSFTANVRSLRPGPTLVPGVFNIFKLQTNQAQPNSNPIWLVDFVLPPSRNLIFSMQP